MKVITFDVIETTFFRNVAFFVGALLAVLLALTVWDEDVLKVEHVLTVITLFTVIITVCQGFIPDEVSYTNKLEFDLKRYLLVLAPLLGTRGKEERAFLFARN